MANIFMKMDDLVGESTVEGFKDWIEVEHVSFNFNSPTSTGYGTGLAQGALVPSDIQVTVVEGVHIIAMLNRQAKGEHWQKVEIVWVKQAASAKLEKYKSIALKEVMVGGYAPNGSSNQGGSESVILSYTDFEYTYFTQDGKGGLKSAGTSGYNAKTKSAR